ncbi:hypothetical protein EV702DRAFT_1048921 [Suillus placidus]|uniref:Inositolphosphotransferase Aur1/Ipt1 domain-containing protein n=1 Tax=Suillus placidus TaxID=48579 RepID=A0A9P7CZF4_9AGAM|nr:hypothetical protein EV702DRAFT_1048921 [Suillus placidus]
MARYTFYSNQFLPADQSVLHGMNISDILTRFTYSVLDITLRSHPLYLPPHSGRIPWLFRPPASRIFAKAFGCQNCIGIFTQIIRPCAAPWYETIYNLTPTAYGTPGSAGGLARIDKLFCGKGYKQIFTSSTLVFGAFPSLQAAWATLQALFIASVLYWSTMYCLNHHCLIDVVGDAQHGIFLSSRCEYPNNLDSSGRAPLAHEPRLRLMCFAVSLYLLPPPRIYHIW